MKVKLFLILFTTKKSPREKFPKECLFNNIQESVLSRKYLFQVHFASNFEIFDIEFAKA